MDAPSMVQRDGDKLIVRRVVSGDEVFLNQTDSPSPASSTKDIQHQSSSASNQSLAEIYPREEDLRRFGLTLEDSAQKSSTSETGDSVEHQLPQCKIKRNYSCSNCTYFTQNPRKYLTHLRDVHGEKIIINECKRCLYASRHYQKLVRHMKMVHGSTDGIKTPFSSRRRGTFRKEYFKKNKFKMNTNITDSDLYSQSRANYFDQLSKMLRGATGASAGSESAGDNQMYLSPNFKPGLTLAEQTQQLSQLKGSSNINIFTDNGGTSSHGCASASGDSSSQVNNDVLAMLQHNLVDKNKQLTITPTSMASGSGRSGADMVTKPKKKVRPIPDLIPLHSIGQLHLQGEVGKTYHLNPEVTIKSRVADSDNNNSINASTSGKSFVIDDESPINLTADPNGDKSLQHQCIFCHIMVRTTDDLAMHLRTCHSEELFALLLQKKPEDNGQTELQSYTAESLTIDIWKRLLENNKAIMEEQESRENDSEMQSGQFSNDEDDAETVESAISRNDTYLGVETAPGYGEVTSKLNIDDGTTQTSIMKKVFKCPHCSFWASTASRFHVHIVGHLNKKPFECSLCSYRSNWRWDITKHIRLKTIRDPSHKNAGVLMNDETGRRNYTKYNRYITLMKVTDNSYKDSSSSSKAMMDTSQADYLAMCKAGESPASLNNLAKMYSSEELAQAFNLATMNQMARFEPEMLQNLVGMPKPLPAEDAKQSPHKVAFKCKKCNFKNPFRELVLLHIKSTHMTIDKSGNAEAELDLLPCGEDQDGEPIEIVTTATNSTLNAQSPLRTSLSPLSVVSPRSDSGNIGGLTGASTSASTTPSVTSGSAGGYNSNNFTTNATLIGVGLNFTQAVANDNRLGTPTYTLSNTIPSVAFGGEVNRTINTASTTTKSTTISASSASASTTNTNTTTTPPSTSTTTTTTTTGGKGASNTWRPSAPYRCGHCHQVSNWKHVIQRHCRLKHNGNVLIEMVNTAKQSQNVTDTRNLKKVRKPFQSFDSVSQDIPVQPVTLHPIELVPEVSLIVQDEPIIHPSSREIIHYPNINSSSTTVHSISIAPVATRTPPMTMTFINLTDESSMEPPSSFPTPMQTDSAPTSDATTEEPYEEPVAPRLKRYQCDACPYVTDSKTQFAYHKSFHKPRGDPYKCNICSYNVTKKHLLIQHQKTHAERTVPSTTPSSHTVSKARTTTTRTTVGGGGGELSIVMGNETKSTGLTPADILDLTKKMRDEVSITPTSGTPAGKMHVDEKIVYYCAYCPARYFDESEIVIHQNRHTQEEKYKCDLCSFSTCDESGISTHRNVHSANYHRGTEELQKLNIESNKHPRSQLVQVGESEKLWVVQVDYEKLHFGHAETPEPEDKPRPRRSTRSKNSSPLVTTTAVTEFTKEPKVYSCEHCDYMDSSECSFKDHVKFHFSAILFPKVDKYAALDKSGEPFKLIATSKDDPDESFELSYESDRTVVDSDNSECNSTDRIIIEI